MYQRLSLSILLIASLTLVLLSSAGAQERKGTIVGHVVDSTQAVVQGASVELQPGGQTAVSDTQGEFTITGVAPGRYKISVNAVGFSQFTNDNVGVTAGGVVSLQAVLKVEARAEVVEVRAPQEQGVVEDVNRERTADNILQVESSETITSLPNANVADAVGRLPGVSLERDEGEGKYIQIRGTEPRLTNVTIDGVNVPSPEGGVRQIKLDTMAADLVESVEVNKTLQANQDGDGIGGSVNIRTKTAGDVPTVTVEGLGGYTPIIGGRPIDQFGGTVGERFGAQKQFGFLIGGTYDWNGRGINDIEPVPAATLAPSYSSMDIRDYEYNRTRWGTAGSADYRLREGSDIYLRGIYSDFQDYGHKWVYTLNSNGLPQASQDWRMPDYAIASVVLGGHHLFNTSWFNWDLSVARSRTLSGDGGANYTWNGDPNIANNCLNVPATDVLRPAWSAGCFTPGIGNATDIRNYVLTQFQEPPNGLTAQLNLQASASYAKDYHLGSHFGTFEFGGKIRNAHKFDDTTQLIANFPAPGAGTTVPGAQFLGGFVDPGYYDGTYHFTNTPDYNLVRTFAFGSGALQITPTGSNFDLIERVTAGYVMNTLDLNKRLRLVGGVRFEATHVSTLGFDAVTGGADAGGTDYVDVLPSVSLRIGLSKDTALRVAYSRALARPDPQDLAQGTGPLVTTQTPNTITLGNPNLKAEHSDNFDLLYEKYLNPVGALTAGFFYKRLTDPIVEAQIAESPSLFANEAIQPTSPFVLASEVENAGSAWVTGFEVAYTQRLSFLPSVLKGGGISANYSHTASEADGLLGLLRTDSPALLRQAPNVYNISPTYDTRRFSLRMGMTYNSAMIFAYQFQNLQADPAGVAGIIPIPPSQLPPLGAKGPLGDNYLYPHFQLDVQGSYKITNSLTFFAYGENLTNEPFGFYNGSPQYVVQREYYHPTYAGGFRWTLSRER